jgi:hypothetical protein
MDTSLFPGGAGLAGIGIFAAPSLISRFVFWPYCAGVASSAIGIWVAKAEVAKARGLEKIVALGGLCFAVPLAVFGAEHLARPMLIMRGVPVWMPWRLFWTYFVGLGLIAAALSFVLKRQVRLSGALLGIMFLLFVLMMDLPGTLANLHNRFAWALMFRELSFSGGAFALAGMQTKEWRARGKHLLVTVARFFIGIPALFYGVENLLHPGVAPGVPLRLVTPTWIPGHAVWGYFAGVVLLVGGASILANRRAREGAAYIGAAVLVLVLVVYLPVMIAKPLSIVGPNYVFDSLLYAGTVLIYAAAVRS